MKKQKVFTAEELSKITLLFEQGLGARKIASALGITRPVAQRAMNNLGLEHPEGYVNPQFKIVGTHQVCANKQCKQNKPIDRFPTRVVNGRLTFLSQCNDCLKHKNFSYHKNKLIKSGKVTRPKNNTPILEDELAKIKTFCEQGLTRKQIGKQLNRSVSRISNTYKQLGIKGKYGTTTRVSREQRQENMKARWKNDPIYRLRRLVSVCIGKALKKNSKTGKGNSSVMDFLPYSIEDLKLYIENQFESWMNWENQGKWDNQTWNDSDSTTWTWQIDHIIPQSDLPYSSMEEDNFKKSWELSNLRPLNTKINATEGSKRVRHNNKNV